MVTLGIAKFYTPYWIRVWAVNSVGQGPRSPAVYAMSAVKVPTKAPQQTISQPFNATSLQVFWDPIPNNRNITGGELSGFHVSHDRCFSILCCGSPLIACCISPLIICLQIQYWPLGSTQSLGRRVTVFGNVTEGQIIGLQPGTDYEVAAQLFNSAGDGTIGRVVMQTTWLNGIYHPLTPPHLIFYNH